MASYRFAFRDIIKIKSLRSTSHGMDLHLHRHISILNQSFAFQHFLFNLQDKNSPLETRYETIQCSSYLQSWGTKTFSKYLYCFSSVKNQGLKKGNPLKASLSSSKSRGVSNQIDKYLGNFFWHCQGYLHIFSLCLCFFLHPWIKIVKIKPRRLQISQELVVFYYTWGYVFSFINSLWGYYFFIIRFYLFFWGC